MYHPPAGKQLPTSCLGRFLRPALSPSAFFSLSLSLCPSCSPRSLSLHRLPSSCRSSALRRDAIRGPESVGPRWRTGAFWSCSTPNALVARALRLYLLLLVSLLLSLSPSPPSPPLKANAARYCTVMCKSANGADTRFTFMLQW